MYKTKKKVKHDEVRNGIRTIIFVGISVIIQFIWIVVLYIRLNAISTSITLILSLLALLVALAINGSYANTAVKTPWIVLILAFPFLGMPLYLMLGRSGATKNMQKRFECIDRQLFPRIKQDDRVFRELEKQDVQVANQCRYIIDYAHFPVYDDSYVEYFSEASDALDAQIESLKKARKFIFMEYHAIEDAQSFRRIEEVLEQKVKEGVEVRLFYDDIGSAVFIDKSFADKMRKKGINCRIFNPMIPLLNVFMDNRDHRKITVIDGIVGYTGGYNMANEYFNVVNPYGHWKDTGVKIVGNAVKNLTITFLEIWNAINAKDIDDKNYKIYLPDADKFIKKYYNFSIRYRGERKGYVQPYADSPLDNEHVGENVYLNAIESATKYIYFMTPYLIITDDMDRALGLAAKRGVDVRIITPGIPDKKAVYTLTKSYYPSLLRRGVKIYEYNPGFCHAKMCVSDDKVATVGTINLGYRSLYHHFEDGVFMYNVPAVMDIKKDFDDTFKKCSRVISDNNDNRKTFMDKVGYSLLRLFAPLL